MTRKVRVHCDIQPQLLYLVLFPRVRVLTRPTEAWAKQGQGLRPRLRPWSRHRPLCREQENCGTRAEGEVHRTWIETLLCKVVANSLLPTKRPRSIEVKAKDVVKFWNKAQFVMCLTHSFIMSGWRGQFWSTQTCYTQNATSEWLIKVEVKVNCMIKGLLSKQFWWWWWWRRLGSV